MSDRDPYPALAAERVRLLTRLHQLLDTMPLDQVRAVSHLLDAALPLALIHPHWHGVGMHCARCTAEQAVLTAARHYREALSGSSDKT